MDILRTRDRTQISGIIGTDKSLCKVKTRAQLKRIRPNRLKCQKSLSSDKQVLTERRNRI